MRAHPVRTGVLLLVVLSLLAATWVYFMRSDAPPQVSVTGARLRWVPGVDGNGSVGEVRLSAADAKRLDQLIAAGPEPLSGSVNCPMDTGRRIRTQFTNDLFSYPTFTIKLDGCSGTSSHQLTPQLTAFLTAYRPK